MKYGWRGILSMTFLIAAQVMFVAFHFSPALELEEGGWHIWPDELWKALRQPQSMFEEPMAGIGITSFLCFSLLIVVSPFLKNVWPKSRLAWWVAVIFSGLTTAGFWIIFCINHFGESPGMGGWCLLLAPVFNFVGLLLAGGKRRIPDEWAG